MSSENWTEKHATRSKRRLFYLERLRKTVRVVSQSNWSSGRDLKQGSADDNKKLFLVDCFKIDPKSEEVWGRHLNHVKSQH
jgi:hypothetical protein